MNVDKDQLLQQELYLIPLALATTDSALRSTNKAELASILEADARNTHLLINLQDEWQVDCMEDLPD